MKVVDIAKELGERVASLEFGPPVTHVYNPLDYAWAPHEAFLEKFTRSEVEVLFLGMNPGPFGMAQTGVPFGEVAAVRDWMGIEAPVGHPAQEHPKRPIQGFDCPRSEVSGRRVWGWAAERFGSAEDFFDRFFVWNYCPLVFLIESGANHIPEKLPAAERQPLFEICDDALGELVAELEPRKVIGIGAFAEGRARKALAEHDVTIGRILHPSPASPAANRGWARQAEEQLHELGIALS